MAEMAEIFPLFRYYSVSSVIDKDNSQSDWRKENMPHGLSAISAIWLPLKRRPLVLREIKKIVSSVRDKNNSHGDWREDIFYNGRNGNYRKRRTSENRVILV